MVAHYDSHNLTWLSLKDGHVEKTIGKYYGNGQGQFNSPRGVSFDPQQGHLWVADYYNDRVQLFNEDGQFIRLFRCCQYPSSVAFLSNGDVVIASRSDHKLHVYSPEGGLRRSIGAFGEPCQLAVVPPAAPGEEDHLAVADSHYSNKCVHIVSSTDGHVVRTLKTAGKPRGVVVTPDQYVIAVEYDPDCVEVFSPEGERVHQWGGTRGSAPGQFADPYHCTLLSDGRVAIADYDNRRIQIF